MNSYVSISGRSSRCLHFFPVSLVITQHTAAATDNNHHHGRDVPFSSNAAKNIEIREEFLPSSCPTQLTRINVCNVRFCKIPDRLQLYVSLGPVLVTMCLSRHKKHLVRFRIKSCFRLKLPVSVATDTTGHFLRLR